MITISHKCFTRIETAQVAECTIDHTRLRKSCAYRSSSGADPSQRGWGAAGEAVHALLFVAADGPGAFPVHVEDAPGVAEGPGAGGEGGEVERTVRNTMDIPIRMPPTLGSPSTGRMSRGAALGWRRRASHRDGSAMHSRSDASPADDLAANKLIGRRILVEVWRLPDIQLGYLLGTSWLTMGMVLSLPILAAGIALVAYALARPRG